MPRLPLPALPKPAFSAGQLLTLALAVVGILWSVIWWNTQDTTMRLRQIEKDNIEQARDVKDLGKRTDALENLLRTLSDSVLELRTGLTTIKPFADEDRRTLNVMASLVTKQDVAMAQTLTLVRDMNDLVQRVGKEQVILNARLDEMKQARGRK